MVCAGGGPKDESSLAAPNAHRARAARRSHRLGTRISAAPWVEDGGGLPSTAAAPPPIVRPPHRLAPPAEGTLGQACVQGCRLMGVDGPRRRTGGHTGPPARSGSRMAPGDGQRNTERTGLDSPPRRQVGTSSRQAAGTAIVLALLSHNVPTRDNLLRQTYETGPDRDLAAMRRGPFSEASVMGALCEGCTCSAWRSCPAGRKGLAERSFGNGVLRGAAPSAECGGDGTSRGYWCELEAC